MKKVLFFDVDGTLVAHAEGKSGIPKNTQKQLKRLQDLGYVLFVASGRPYAFISESISKFNFDGYVLCNGAHVEVAGKIIYQHVMDIDKTKKLVQELDLHGSEYILQTSRYSYLKPEFRVLYDFYQTCVINNEYLSQSFKLDDIYPNVLKMEINAPDDKLEYLEEVINGDFNYDRHGTKNAFEVYAKGVTKATGVKKVLEYYNLPKEASYGFGDGLNDLEMIQEVGTGVAMGNAVDELKEVANIVCESVYDDGLAKILDKLF